MAEQAKVSQITNNASNTAVLGKLAVFSLSLAVVPISVFFGFQYYFSDLKRSDTYAAIAAVVSANIVMGIYIFASIQEDRKETAPVSTSPPKETKKNQ